MIACLDIFVLTFEYFDKSACYICGVTQNIIVASTWRAAGGGEHRVYKLTLDQIKDHTTGWEEWK